MKHKKHASHSHDPDTEKETSGETVMEQTGVSVPPYVADTTNTAASAVSNHEELEKRLKIAEDTAAEAESLYKRMAADFENYRKRIDRERQDFRSFGLQQAIEALLPALDDLDRAQTGLNAQMSSEDLLQSIKLVFNRIRQSVEQIGLQSIEAIGEHFDPQFHEPVQKVETSEFPDGVVMEVLRKGYTLNGKVIRPALVNVASGKPLDHQEEPAESKT